ncbi:3-oxoacyl-[acyl-carrier-protein] synthase-3 [Catalinimonas alkaloidigena]|uniref:Beta-ketoacyl-[acyl-carrier-protein] synthase III n=2 Tax=Catalinimonas alkaloidigena TaxID=1075417 RepID=A0A1G9J9S1_9BACT|nr:3-oxoacyl-[acyl-carrier-protein] synthase-3 [Catalinimonas alkaloidigena]
MKGVGHYVPERVVTNAELEEQLNTSDTWIRERTGIQERHFFTPGKDTVASMSAAAARMALDRAGLQAQDIDFIVLATITPDYYFPGSGVLLQRELGLPGIGALDIRVQCTGFIYALSIADQYIKTGMYKHVLVIGAEIQSSAMDMTPRGRGVSVIFGDGAGAAVVSASEEQGRGVLSTHLHADGTYAEELVIKDPGSSRPQRMYEAMGELDGTYCYMNGNAIFKHAIQRFSEAVQEALATNHVTKDEIDLLVPHQANYRITRYLQEQLELRDEQVFSNIHKYGNTTAASIPIALSEAWAEGRIQSGDLVCLAAFGSGFTWGSALIRW